MSTGRGGPIGSVGGDDRGERSVRALDFSLRGEESLREDLSLFLRTKFLSGSLLKSSRGGRGESRRGDRSLRGERSSRRSRRGVNLKAATDLAPSMLLSSTSRVLL
ncbi:unnamed protein product [Arabidopsis halleri]